MDVEAADATFHRFLRIMRFLRQHRYQIKSQGISARDYSVLRLLLEGGPATVGQVQTYLQMSASTTSVLLADLEVADLVRRERCAEDNRVVNVSITARGRTLAERTPLGGLPLLRYRLRELPAARLGALDGALNELMELLDMPAGDESA